MTVTMEDINNQLLKLENYLKENPSELEEKNSDSFFPLAQEMLSALPKRGQREGMQIIALSQFFEKNREAFIHNKATFINLGIPLLEMIPAFLQSLTSLNLRENKLGNKSVDELVQILSAIPTTVTSLDLTGNHLDKLGSVQEVGDLLLGTGKIITLGLTPFEQQLRTYINSIPMLQLALGINQVESSQQQKVEAAAVEEVKTPNQNLLNRFFGATNNSPNDPLGDLKALHAVAEFLSFAK